MSKRLFLAINLPQDVRDALENYQNLLAKKGLPVRWLKNNNLHLTLRFLGELDEKYIVALVAALESFFNKYPSLELKSSKILGFPDLIAPRVIVLELEKTPPLEKMVQDLFVLIDSLELPIKKETRPFRSHITLARVKYEAGIWKILEGEKFTDQFEVKSVELMESELLPTHAEYKVIKSFSLQ